MAGYGVNKICNSAAVIGKQVRCIKRCDQVMIAGFKRCDASMYDGYAMRDMMTNHVSMGMKDYMRPPGCLSLQSREPILPSASSRYSLILFLCILAAARSNDTVSYG